MYQLMEVEGRFRTYRQMDRNRLQFCCTESHTTTQSASDCLIKQLVVSRKVTLFAAGCEVCKTQYAVLHLEFEDSPKRVVINVCEDCSKKDRELEVFLENYFGHLNVVVRHQP